tara:strand:- start:32204 stop:34690 length:2487 start_codon:yes stop_codon:yes gene_type:complete
MSALCFLCLSPALGFFAYAQNIETGTDPNEFLKQHCIQCHGEEKQKGDRRFDSLGTDFQSDDTAYVWQEILDVLNLGEMPPKEEPPPSLKDLRTMVSWITGELELAYARRASNEAPLLRRLNRYEYRYTIRDLFGLNIDSFDPTASFPPDEKFEGFTNVGEELILSDYLLEQYLEAASQTIEKAIFAKQDITPIHEVFTPDDLCDRTYHFRPQIWFEVNVDGSYVDVGHGDRKSERVYADRFEKGVPTDGYYTIRIKSEGINREHPYDSKLLGIDRNEPIKMEVLVTDPKIGYPGRRYNASDRIVARIPLMDHEAKIYEVRVWMDEGFVPVVRYANGPRPFKGVLTKIAPVYHREVLPSNWRDGVATQPAENQEIYLSDVYQGPRMRIHWMEIQGPEAGHEMADWLQVHGEGFVENITESGIERIIENFAFKAFRRPSIPSEIDRYVDFYQKRRELGDDAVNAVKTVFKAMLSSPNFIYVETPLDEPDENKAFTIASRLSYFLWSSTPDEVLLNAALNDRLGDSKSIVAQALRMLKDPKARAFSNHFTDSWLRLNELGSMPPDLKKFSQYHDRELEPLMKEETRLFFEDILQNNRSIENFIHSDFTYVNGYLADLYGIEGVYSDSFSRVRLPVNSPRGGVLGQASILTVTSNGVETSPVKRGIWVLENILGTPPAPPPPDVEPLEPDIRGATTIREQLAKHRKVETCADCHRKIDPIGFALESFDPIGSYRSQYQDDGGISYRNVDTSGTLATGESFTDVSELKGLLMDRKNQFARCLVEKMLIYALGRELYLGDRPIVDDIVNELAARNYGLKDLVELIVTSEAFSD